MPLDLEYMMEDLDKVRHTCWEFATVEIAKLFRELIWQWDETLVAQRNGTTVGVKTYGPATVMVKILVKRMRGRHHDWFENRKRKKRNAKLAKHMVAVRYLPERLNSVRLCISDLFWLEARIASLYSQLKSEQLRNSSASPAQKQPRRILGHLRRHGAKLL